MSRATYVLIDGELIQKAKDGEITEEYRSKVSGGSKNPFAGFGGDLLGEGVNGVLNPADGKRYDSKSEYNKAVRAKGCRIVGNDWNNKQFKRPDVRGDFNLRPDMQRAINKVLWRN